MSSWQSRTFPVAVRRRLCDLRKVRGTFSDVGRTVSYLDDIKKLFKSPCLCVSAVKKNTPKAWL